MHLGGVQSFLAPWKQEQKGPKSGHRLAAWESECQSLQVEKLGHPAPAGQGKRLWAVLLSSLFSLWRAPKP